jgi:hypothetical protein
MFLAIAQSVPVQSIINNLLIFDLEFLCAIVKLIGFLGWGFSGWNRAEVSSACVPPSSGCIYRTGSPSVKMHQAEPMLFVN